MVEYDEFGPEKILHVYDTKSGKDTITYWPGTKSISFFSRRNVLTSGVSSTIPITLNCCSNIVGSESSSCV